MKTTYEYRSIEFDGGPETFSRETVKALNELGKEGWAACDLDRGIQRGRFEEHRYKWNGLLMRAVIVDEAPKAIPPCPTAHPVLDQGGNNAYLDDHGKPLDWKARVVFDHNVSETSPVVKGTRVTVAHIVSLVVDGWSWLDIRRFLPELSEDDIRAALAYTVEAENERELAGQRP